MLAARRPLTVALGAALFAVAACSDSTAPKGSLTADEISELAAQMGEHFASAFAGSAASATKGALLNAVPQTITVSVEQTVPCPVGGESRVTATVHAIVDDATESIKADVNGTQRPKDCGFDVQGKTISVTGTLTSTAHVEIVNGLPVGEQTSSLVGSFDWRTSDGRRGTCNVNYAASANYSTNVATVNGNFCGQTIQITETFTP